MLSLIILGRCKSLHNTFFVQTRTVFTVALCSQFQLDGNITGIDLSRIEGLLNETDVMSSNVIFENLNVTGNIVFEDSINTKTWSDFNDILLRSEKSAIITGNKKFLNNVNVGSNVTIELDEINGHAISEFVTVNSDQQLPRKCISQI